MDINWSQLPSEILAEVFKYVPTKNLLNDIPLVCRSWRDVLHQLSFWWKRLGQEGIMISKELRLVLIKTVEHQSIVQLFKTACANNEPLPTILKDYHKLFMAWSMYENFWSIDVEAIRVASVCLLLRQPQRVLISAIKKVPLNEDLDILLLLLSHAKCEVAVRGPSFATFNEPFMLDDLLKNMTNKNVNCVRLLGCTIESVDSLMKSITTLHLFIQHDKSGKTLDPGLVRLPLLLPNLKELQIKARTGTDIPDIPNIITSNNSVSYSVNFYQKFRTSP